MGLGCTVCGESADYEMRIMRKPLKFEQPTNPENKNLDYNVWARTYGICSKECLKKLCDRDDPSPNVHNLDMKAVGKPVVIHLDTLVRKCGYFDGQSPVNNGYGCNHPDVEDYDEFEGESYGKCYSSVCPIAIPLSPNEYEEDRKYFDDVGVGDWKNMTDGDWMLVHGEYKIQRHNLGKGGTHRLSKEQQEELKGDEDE